MTNLVFEEGLRLDVLVENEVICELKAIETVNPVWEAQVLSPIYCKIVVYDFLQTYFNSIFKLFFVRFKLLADNV